MDPPKATRGKKQPGPARTAGTKLRGLPNDSPDVRLSKTFSWLLRHGAQADGLPMRPDGYVKVTDLLENPKVKSQSVTFEKLQELVKADSKQRFDLVLEGSEGSEGIWIIKARQGHSIQEVKVDFKPVIVISDIPTGIAVHGTTRVAWESIAKQGLSKMQRNHIHLAQGVGADIKSGMRKSSQIFIYINVQKALDDGVKFFLSDNGVVLTEGEDGFLATKYFLLVEDVKHGVLDGWAGVHTLDASISGTFASTSATTAQMAAQAP
ncbi:hypothetical protein BDN72DRAFT_768167 [Pluteus cervinus]|uniref:Uncharacterized protein n=1 Tax=Pluteus cervinus TaxID=181527 RepID=A0ACD3AUG1_9AGAR|nr:hypothetical protein BDN72DRAFT_768167 [Pluteus cervinus]